MIEKKTIQPKKVLDEEVKWDKTQTIISKTDPFGTILYMNDAFEATSEYNKIELIGEAHNVIRHPDMPKVVFKILWKALKKGENFNAIVKNLSRSGRYYWVITDFTSDKDEKGKIIGYTGRRKAVPQSVVEKIKPLYKSLLQIEKEKGEKASELYFEAYLKEETGKSYDEFVLDLFQSAVAQKEVENEAIKALEKETAENKKRKRGLNWFFGS